MLRRIPVTPLVCLVILVSAVFATSVNAAGPNEPLEVLLKPDNSTLTPVVQTARSRNTISRHSSKQAVWVCPPPPMGITKVKAIPACAPPMPFNMCILPQPRAGQWDMSAQVFFARSRGKIQWPRQSWYYSYGWNQDVDFNDQLGLPAHQVLAQFTAKYQFRPNWAIRGSLIRSDFNGDGGGQSWNNWGFYFGNQWFTNTWGINTKWEHGYYRLGLVYDAVKNCRAAVSIYADWVHTDDKIGVNCSYCGYQTSVFSKGGDSAMVGLELQKCLATTRNGGTFSLDNKAGVIFFDNVEGWDVQAGAKYSVPLNYGRWGYMKGGYRLIDLKKSQPDLIFNHALEGGFMEFGFIF